MLAGSVRNRDLARPCVVAHHCPATSCETNVEFEAIAAVLQGKVESLIGILWKIFAGAAVTEQKRPLY